MLGYIEQKIAMEGGRFRRQSELSYTPSHMEL